MSKIGPYRKGKKAFKFGKQNKASIRYLLHLARKRERAIFAFKLAKIAVTSAMTARQILIIQSKPIPKYPYGSVLGHGIIDENIHPLEKSLAIVGCLIDSATQIQKILSE